MMYQVRQGGVVTVAQVSTPERAEQIKERMEAQSPFFFTIVEVDISESI